MKSNASMQKLNNVSAFEIQVNTNLIDNADEEMQAVNNRSTTPLMKKGF